MKLMFLHSVCVLGMGRIIKLQNFVCSLFDHATCHTVNIFLSDVKDYHEERGVAHTASILRVSQTGNQHVQTENLINLIIVKIHYITEV